MKQKLNTPVNFFRSADNESCAHEFAQLAEQGDIVSFQVPQVCRPVCTEMNCDTALASIDPGGCNSPAEGTGNAGTHDWELFTGIDLGGGVNTGIKALSTSKIFSIECEFNTDIFYKVSCRLKIADDCAITFVLFKSYTDDASTDYEIIETIEGAADSLTHGEYTFGFLTEQDYVRLGFYVSGSCMEDNYIAGFSILEESFVPCLSPCVQDMDGNVVGTPDTAQYYHDHINVTFVWGSLGLEPGCYRICICNDDIFLGENLFTLADNGTMEADINGLSAGIEYAKTADDSYYGDYSFSATMTNDDLQHILITDELTLQSYRSYKIKCRIKFPDEYDAELRDNLSWSLINFTGATDVEIVPVINSPFGTDWFGLEMSFTTGYDPTGSFSIVFNQSSNQFNENPVFIDDIILYDADEYVTCSRPFLLDTSHDGTILLSWTNNEDAFGINYSFHDVSNI